MRERVVQIRCGKSSRGAGFVVAPGVVATALHVVADRQRDPPVWYTPHATLTFARLVGERWETVEVEGHAIDGACDREEDWALISFEPPAGYGEPLPLGRVDPDEVLGGRLAWTTWGFPATRPDHGHLMRGHVRSAEAAVPGLERGVRALQLFGAEAAAGDGYPIPGFSGAPVMVDGRAVGVLRSALLRAGSDGQRRSEGGVLYAAPIEQLRLADGRAVAPPDPWLLPPLADDEPLPARPFRDLHYYEESDARVFFGRRNELRTILSMLADEAAPRVLLLCGPTGVGKSSFLRAGLAPRLPAGGRLELAARTSEGLAATWATLAPRDASVRVVDQVEEAWTRGADGDAELASLLTAIDDWLRGHRAAGQVILSFRKEWLPEIQEGLRLHGLRWQVLRLSALDRRGLLTAATSLERDPVLVAHYGLSLEGGLAERIADDLASSRGVAVAPLFQVVMTRLWDGADVVDGGRRLTLAAYEALRGMSLERFLDERLRGLSPEHRRAAEAGLVFEVLLAHTTAGGTASQRPFTELLEAFDPAIRDQVAGISEDLELLGLLVANDTREARRLVHDALAPVVRHRVAVSSAPAQRARRLLEARLPDWQGEQEGDVLDTRSWGRVKRALRWLPRPDRDTARLIRATRAAYTPGRRLRRWTPAIALVVVLGAAALVERSDAFHQWWVERALLAAAQTDKRHIETDILRRELLGYPELGGWGWEQERLVGELRFQALGLDPDLEARSAWGTQGLVLAGASLDAGVGRPAGAAGCHDRKGVERRATCLAFVHEQGLPVDWAASGLLSSPHLGPEVRPLPLSALAGLDAGQLSQRYLQNRLLRESPARALRATHLSPCDRARAMLGVALRGGDVEAALLAVSACKGWRGGEVLEPLLRLAASGHPDLDLDGVDEDLALLVRLPDSELDLQVPQHLRSLALQLLGPDERLLPPGPATTEVAVTELVQAADAALRIGRRAVALWLARRAGESVGALSSGSWDADRVFDLLIKLGDREVLAAMARDAVARGDRDGLACLALLEGGDADGAVACAVDRQRFDTPLNEARLALALHDAQRPTAAAEVLEHLERRVVDETGVSRVGGWFFETARSDACEAALDLAIAYARIGRVRDAHLAGRRCAHEAARWTVYAEIVAHARGHELWAPRRLSRWLGEELGL